MSSHESVRFHLDQIFKKFPNDSAAAASLYYSNETFRCLCEDYSLALITLASFEKMPDAATRKEVSEYQAIVSDLEDEIRTYLGKVAKD